MGQKKQIALLLLISFILSAIPWCRPAAVHAGSYEDDLLVNWDLSSSSGLAQCQNVSFVMWPGWMQRWRNSAEQETIRVISRCQIRHLAPLVQPLDSQSHYGFMQTNQLASGHGCLTLGILPLAAIRPLFF